MESLKTPKKWATIAKNFGSRNCHQIKNRFIVLMSKEMNCKGEKIRELINGDQLIEPISAVLNQICQMANKHKETEDISNKKDDESSKNAKEIDFESFINFQSERPSFKCLD